MPPVDSCHDNGPPGPLQPWSCIWRDKSVEKDFELKGMELKRLLRLRPDFRDEDCWRPRSRVDFMTLAAREALRDNNCEIVGGFIRDWVIRGEVDAKHGTPKDVDIRMWKAFDIPAYICRCQRNWDLTLDEWDHKRRSIQFRTPSGDVFQVDYVVEDDQFASPPKSIDLDVNSFAVSTDCGLHRREYLKRPISKTYGNIKRKVAYLIAHDPEDACECDYMKYRVAKMKKREWTVIKADDLYRNCSCKWP